MELKLRNPNVGPWDWLLIVICIGVVVYAGYTMHNLNKIQTKCVDDCNKFWLREFAKDCQNEMYREDGPGFLGLKNYTIGQNDKQIQN